MAKRASKAKKPVEQSGPVGEYQQPITSVVWVERDSLRPNDYNPNHVPKPELDLLALSILEDGWTQPIVCLPDMTIVDGFHRWTVAGRPEVAERTHGKVPVVIINVDSVHRKMSTIRHNRARGIHGVVPMAAIVRSMIEEGVKLADIQARLGMEYEEVERLADRSGMPIRGSNKEGKFGAAWKPTRA